MKYQEYHFKKEIKQALQELNYITPTPIQEQTIPLILEGVDVIGQAKTGTGKTAAFGLPIIQNVNTNEPQVQYLIMTPTRELAQQVEAELVKFSKYIKGFRSVCVYGGAPISQQIRSLKAKPQIVIGTPGRLLDHIRRKTVKLHQIKGIIMDEADEMLKMGFQEDIEAIINQTPAERQTLLFSATMPKTVLRIANKYQKNAQLVHIESETMTVDKIDQYYYHIKQSSKFDLLIRLLDFYNFKSSIIFCNTKAMVDELTEKLQKEGFKAEAIHGDLKQVQRDRVMNNFRRNNLKILVATDVAARGIDVKNIDVIFNYDIPQEDELYIHRIGRTGRAGNNGLAITFVNHRQKYRINSIEKLTNSKISKANVPTVHDINQSRVEDTYQEIKHVIKSNTKPNELMDRLHDEGFSKTDIINSLLDLYLTNSSRVYENVEEVVLHEHKKQSSRKRNDKSRNNTSNSKKPYKGTHSSGKKAMITFNIGKNENLTPKGLVTYLATHAKVNKQTLGNITIHKNDTILETTADSSAKIIQQLNGKKYHKTNLNIKKI